MGYELFLSARQGSPPPDPARVREIAISAGASETSDMRFSFRGIGHEIFARFERAREGKDLIVISLEYGGSMKEAEFAFSFAMKLASALSLDVFDPQIQRVIGETDFNLFLDRWKQHSDWSLDMRGGSAARYSPPSVEEPKGFFARIPAHTKFLLVVVLCLIVGLVALKTCVNRQVARILAGETP